MRFLLPSLFLFSTLYGLYNGNPALPKVPEEGFFLAKEAWMGVRIGYEGDFIAKPDMNDHLHRCKIVENFGTFTLNFLERFDLYVSGGSFYSSLHRTKGDSRWEFETHAAPIWKVGARALLWEYGETFFTLHVGLAQASPRLQEAVLNGSPLARKRGKFFYREAEAGAAVAHKIDIFIPYIGIESSFVHVKVKHIEGKFESRNRTPLGLFLGCGLTPGAKVIVNVEVRLVDEQAVSLSGDMRF